MALEGKGTLVSDKAYFRAIGLSLLLWKNYAVFAAGRRQAAVLSRIVWKT